MKLFAKLSQLSERKFFNSLTLQSYKPGAFKKELLEKIPARSKWWKNGNKGLAEKAMKLVFFMLFFIISAH